MKKYDVLIIGAGAAGLSAAGVLCTRGRRVAVLEMGNAPARKVMISGGGRCNITNMDTSKDRYFGKNPDFVRGALSRVKPQDIIDWAKNHKLKLVEKSAGRYFCQNGADAVVDALLVDAKNADFIYNEKVINVVKDGNLFQVNGKYLANSVILATGGISFASVGVSDTGYHIAKHFGHTIVPVQPGLCALNLKNTSPELAGITIDAEITIGRTKICDSMLFTHLGIGGPAAYRASLYNLEDGIHINLVPGVDLKSLLIKAKRTNGRKSTATIMAEYMPQRIARWLIAEDNRNIADIKDSDIAKIAMRANDIFIPGPDIKRHGLTSAEVVRGGISTHEISSKTMESKLCSGLFIVGEVMDIAGDLGGFNLHWAWASGRVAGENA